MSKFWKKIFTSKYTGKQIDEAVGKVLDGDVGMSNPMTAAGDIIVGGTDGEPEKLVKGTDGKVLKMVSGAPAWADDAGGMENPMTAAGDMIIGGADGAATRLPKGTDGQVLTLASGAPAWAAAQGGGGGDIYKTMVTVRQTQTAARFIMLSGTALYNQDSTNFGDFISKFSSGERLNWTGGAIQINAKGTPLNFPITDVVKSSVVENTLSVTHYTNETQLTSGIGVTHDFNSNNIISFYAVASVKIN